jgi:NAD(P)-dependent dehydrogenase (short-subunit alcohol dehydrogenase family)
MALELAAHGIRVNAIAPDYTLTPGTHGNIKGPVDPAKWLKPTPASQDANNRRIPLGRPGIDMECGQAALFLASAMSSYVNGVILPVDGGTWASSGWTRHHATGQWSLTDAALPAVIQPAAMPTGKAP